MTPPPMDRRSVLQAAAAGSLLPWLPLHGWSWQADRAGPDASQVVVGKDPRLIVHGAEPVEIETPLELLRGHRLTPAELIFVRNNQQLEDTLTLAVPKNPDDWTVDFTGLVEQPRQLKVGALAALPQIEVEMVLQCSGNGRYFFHQVHPSKPGDKLWAAGALANLRFGGVALRTVFEHLKLRPKAEARFITAQGKDRPLKAGVDDFEHSLPLDDALARTLLATRLNGAPLPAIHGGPVRLVTPGYYGTVNVKWLHVLSLDAHESRNYHHERRYRTPRDPVPPGSDWVSTLENSEANWRMKVKSVIWNPLAGEKLRPGRHKIQGVAWNDGSCPLEAVEISLDRGQSWRRAQVDKPASPFAWYVWQLEADLPAGKADLWARAIDAWGRTQPLSGAIHWNPGGYAWNGVHQVQVDVG